MKILLLIFLLFFSAGAHAALELAKAAVIYTGLSTDTKPTDLIGASSLFFETDTRIQYEYDGAAWEAIKFKGSSSIHDADVHHAVINKYLHQNTAVSTTLSSDSAVNDYQINVADTTGFVAGDVININTTSIEQTHPVITAVTPGTPGVLTLDRRLDKAHLTGDTVTEVIINLSSQIGTLASPQIYWAGPEPGEVWHIITLTLAMGHSTAGDVGLFGNLSALTNGIIVRARINGNYGTLTNWKTNSDIDVDTGNVEFPIRSGGLGTFGTTTIGPFNDRTGAILRLDGDLGDRYEIYVQDDITGIIFWNMKVQGHHESL